VSGLESLDGLAERRRKNLGRAVAPRVSGPVDRRLTVNRRISVTALVPEEVDLMCVRSCPGGVVLTTDLSASAGPATPVRTVGARREIWLRGKDVRALLPPTFRIRRDRFGQRRSVPLDVYVRRYPDQHLELELLVRGARSMPW
jgi:hypothetical protein